MTASISSRRSEFRVATLRESDAARQRSPRRIYGLIKMGILRGVFVLGEQIFEDQLVEAYATTRNAVRSALRMLADEGLISRHPKSGTIVVQSLSRVPLRPDGQASGREELMVPELVERAEVPATVLLRQRLRTERTHVSMGEWVLREKDEAVGVLTAYWKEDLATIFPCEDGAAGQLAERFEFAYGAELGVVDLNVTAVQCEAWTSRILGVPLGSALLVRERLAYDVSGMPREYSFTYFPAGKVTLQMTVPTGGDGS